MAPRAWRPREGPWPGSVHGQPYSGWLEFRQRSPPELVSSGELRVHFAQPSPAGRPADRCDTSDHPFSLRAPPVERVWLTCHRCHSARSGGNAPYSAVVDLAFGRGSTRASGRSRLRGGLQEAEDPPRAAKSTAQKERCPAKPRPAEGFIMIVMFADHDALSVGATIPNLCRWSPRRACGLRAAAWPVRCPCPPTGSRPPPAQSRVTAAEQRAQDTPVGPRRSVPRRRRRTRRSGPRGSRGSTLPLRSVGPSAGVAPERVTNTASSWRWGAKVRSSCPTNCRRWHYHCR